MARDAARSLLCRAAWDHEIADKDLHRLALLIERRRADLDHSLFRSRFRGSHLEHFALNAQLIPRPYRTRPAEFVEPGANDTADGLDVAFDQEAHGKRGGVPAAGGKSAEQALARGLPVEMKGLRIELAREAHDFCRRNRYRSCREALADVQIVQPPKPKQAASTDKQAVSTGKAEAKADTPADVINARGFWGDTGATPNQATPAQVAALNARQALASADPQPTASVSSPLQALAYAPAANSPVDRANIVAASAPLPRSIRPASALRNAMASTKIDLVVAKGAQGQGNLVATSTRLAASGASDTWMRMMILAPSASTSMNATVLGDVDMTVMRSYFVKPDAAIAMGFSDDPMLGMACDHFAGSATATLATQSFVTRTAALR